MVFVIAWQFVPFHSLIYQGGVRQIPVSLYEAAHIDGAGRVRQFFHITLPQLKYTIITSSTLMLVGSLTYFDLIFVLTARRSGQRDPDPALDMYLPASAANHMGAASVIAVILVVVGLALASALSRLGGRDRSRARWKGLTDDRHHGRPSSRTRHRAPGPRHPGKGRRNYLGGLAGWIWLAIIIVPIYYIVDHQLQEPGRLLLRRTRWSPPSRPNAGRLRRGASRPTSALLPQLGDRHRRLRRAGGAASRFMASYAIVRGGAGSCAFAKACSCWAWPSRCRRRSSRST